MKLFISN